MIDAKESRPLGDSYLVNITYSQTEWFLYGSTLPLLQGLFKNDYMAMLLSVWILHYLLGDGTSLGSTIARLRALSLSRLVILCSAHSLADPRHRSCLYPIEIPGAKV